MKKILSIFLVLCLGPKESPGQSTFEKKIYVGFENRLSCQVRSLPDSSFLFLNYIMDSIYGRQDFGLTRIDKSGNTLQNKVTNIHNKDYLVSSFGFQQFIEISKSAYFLTGVQVINNKYSVVVNKIDRFSLDTTATVVFTDSVWHYLMQDLVKFSDNKFLLSGTRGDGTKTQPYLFTLDSNLTVTQTLQVNTLEMLNTKVLYNPLNKKILLGGRFLRPVKHFSNIGLMEIDTLGVITNTYISSSTYSLVAAQIYYSEYDSTYVIVGHQVTYEFGSKRLKRLNISKHDRNLKLLWRKSYGGEGRANGLPTATILPDGSIVAVGCYGIYDMVDYNGVILKVDKNGNPKWMREYNNLQGPNSLAEAFGGIDQTLDGGFIVVGSVGFETQGKAWVLKTDSVGCVVPGCPSLSVSVNSALLDGPSEPVDTGVVYLPEHDRRGVPLEIFPNPAEDLVVIRHGCGDALASRSSIRIFSVDGSLFKTIGQLSGTGTNVADMSAASRGIYLVQLLVDGRVVKNVKLVRE